MVPFVSSLPGRLLFGAAGVALLGGGLYALRGNIVVLAIAMPIAIALGVIACGRAIVEYGTEALFAVLWAPLALFLFGVGVGVAQSEGRHWLAWGFVALGVIALVRALSPRRSADDATQSLHGDQQHVRGAD